MNTPRMLPKEGFVRLRQIIGPDGCLPVSRSSFYAGVKTGLWPAPKKCGAMSLWSVAELRACLARLETSADTPIARTHRQRAEPASLT
jgi:predicted DNA-binding transcriptional regulator AlpA